MHVSSVFNFKEDAIDYSPVFLSADHSVAHSNLDGPQISVREDTALSDLIREDTDGSFPPASREDTANRREFGRVRAGGKKKGGLVSRRSNIDHPQISVALRSEHEEVRTEGLVLRGRCPIREDADETSPSVSREDAASNRKLDNVRLEGGKGVGIANDDICST